MLYQLIRPLAAVALKVYLRKITFLYTERIPKNKPVILACNHPTAFMEPCILACGLSRPLYFLVRGDVFTKPFYKRLLKALHMLPVYRLKDRGYAFVKANYETFDTCYDALKDRLSIMILAEGTTISEKRLRPLKKGTARVAFGALEKYPEIDDVYIVPVGVNFDQIGAFRSEVIVRFGTPISTRDYYPAFYSNNNEGIDQLTAELATRMAEQIVIIEKKADEGIAEQLLLLSRLKYKDGSDKALQTEIDLSRTVNGMPEEQKAGLSERIYQYQSALHASGVSDKTVFDGKGLGILPALGLLTGFMPAALGALLNFLPAALAKWIADTRVDSKEFYGSVLLTVALFLYLLYYGTGAIFLYQFMGVYWLWILPVTAVLGYFAIKYSEFLQITVKRWRWSRMKLSQRVALQHLQQGVFESIQ